MVAEGLLKPGPAEASLFSEEDAGKVGCWRRRTA
jgi:hypothetical protein